MGRFSGKYMMVSKTLLSGILFLLHICFAYHAKAQFDFNTRCIHAYETILSLDFQSGKQLLDKEKNNNPGNLIPVFLENYIDFLTLSTGEDPSDFQLLKPNRSQRIDKIKDVTAQSPWQRHCQAAIYLQWSFVRVKFGEYMMAGLDLNRAYRLLEENKTLYPGFVPDLLLSGVMDALIGSVPDNYKWVLKLASMEGTIETGREKLYELIDVSETNPDWAHLKNEAFFYLSFIEMNLQSSKEYSHRLLQRMRLTDGMIEGPLTCYIIANLFMRTGENNSAIETIQNCVIPEGSYRFHYLDFMLGTAKLNQLNPDAASHFLSFINNYRGGNYLKSAYQRLAWISLLKNDLNAYRFYISKIPNTGQAFVDEDKQADKEASSNQIPNIGLLKARLLFDGGYYEEAIQILESDSILHALPLQKDSVEYVYRKARIYHEWGKLTQAKDFYRQTVERGSNLPYFYAGNAALQLGLIFENEDDYISAEYYFNQCLGLRFSEYRSSIQHKARVGLQRIQTKKAG